MNVMIDVSIIITNYNYSKYLNRSIRSAFVQRYSDRQYEIIESYGKKINAILLKEKVGLAAARNVGIKAAKGRYIMFLDADDYLNQDIIYIESMFLNLNSTWDAVACDYYLIDDSEEEIGRNSCMEIPIACGIMFRKERLIEIGMYDESFKMWEEKDLRIRFLEKFKVHHIELPLYRYRKHDKNLTNDKIVAEKYMDKLNNKHGLK